MAGATRPLLLLEGITKAWPGVVANEAIDLELWAGEIHTLLGENGAGKTTLVGIVYGLHRPDAGRILVEDREVVLRSPRDALALGIGFVQQHFSLVPTLTVAQNLVLALRSGGSGIRASEGTARARELARRYGLDVDPDAVVEDLSVGQQQRAELLKALARDTRILILDEPGSVLTPQESTELATILRRLADAGVAVLLISHKLDEVLRVSDRITVLRRGRRVGTLSREQATRQRLAEMMIGEIRQPTAVVPAAPVHDAGPRPIRLAVEHIWVASDRGGFAVQGAGFHVREGEIVGIAGVEGSGQVELTEAIAGVRRVARGRLVLGGRALRDDGVHARQRAGIGHVPADRQTTGIVQTLSVAEVLALPQIGERAFSRVGLLRAGSMRRNARALLARFDIRPPSPDLVAGSLSGGNQQKLVLAREISRRPTLLVCCYPTRGLDFAATDAVQREVSAMRDAGASVIYASVDIDELVAVCDRIVVMSHGRVTGELRAADATPERLGLLMAGVTAA